MEENYLIHHGVLGMKWGVRRAVNRQNSDRLARIYSRGVNKIKKSERKINKLELKASKKRAKAFKWYNNAESSLQYQRKANKLEFKAKKMRDKNIKYAKSLHEQFSSTPVSKLSKSVSAENKAYIKNYINNKVFY